MPALILMYTPLSCCLRSAYCHIIKSLSLTYNCPFKSINQTSNNGFKANNPNCLSKKTNFSSKKMLKLNVRPFHFPAVTHKWATELKSISWEVWGEHVKMIPSLRDRLWLFLSFCRLYLADGLHSSICHCHRCTDHPCKWSRKWPITWCGA